MQYIDILGALGKITDLKLFADTLFTAVGASEIEERESSNYVGGYYFKAKRDGLFFRVCIADEEDNEDLPFWV